MPSIRPGPKAGPATAPAGQAARRRWLALAVLAVAQFMIFLDR